MNKLICHDEQLTINVCMQMNALLSVRAGQFAVLYVFHRSFLLFLPVNRGFRWDSLMLLPYPFPFSDYFFFLYVLPSKAVTCWINFLWDNLKLAGSIFSGIIIHWIDLKLDGIGHYSSFSKLKPTLQCAVTWRDPSTQNFAENIMENNLRIDLS